MTFKATVLALLLVPAGLAEAQEAAWDWKVAPYLWASSVGLDLAVAEDTTSGGDAAFKDLLGSLRYIAADIDALVTRPAPVVDPVDIPTGPSETDLMVGVRAIGRFAQPWRRALRGDLSFGGSEGTNDGLASFGYTFGESDLFMMTQGYRYLSIELDGRIKGTTAPLPTSLCQARYSV